MPERCFSIPARGGFLFSGGRGHAADDFAFATEWARYDWIDDRVAKIRYYLDHFDEARRIAEAAHRCVTRQHTYEHRAQKLLAAAEVLRTRGVRAIAQ